MDIKLGLQKYFRGRLNTWMKEFRSMKKKMKKTLASLEAELATIRAGRANPHILDKLTVDYYGSPTPLQQVANITVPEARMIQIQPWESRPDQGNQRSNPYL